MPRVKAQLALPQNLIYPTRKMNIDTINPTRDAQRKKKPHQPK